MVHELRFRESVVMMGYSECDERYINMLVTEHYWDDIAKAFDDRADVLTKQVYYNGNYYQCKIIDNNFCIGAKYAFSET